MIQFATLFIIFITLILVVLIKSADDWALNSVDMIEANTKELLELIEAMRKEIAELNKKLEFIKKLQKLNLSKIFSTILNVINAIIILYPAKNKLPLVKKLLSFRFFKATLALLKSSFA